MTNTHTNNEFIHFGLGVLLITLSACSPGNPSEEQVSLSEPEHPEHGAQEETVFPDTIPPTAMVQLHMCGDSESSENCLENDSIRPLQRVFLDASKSYATTGHVIAQYLWEVVSAPQGVNPADYDWSGQSSSHASFWIPVAGAYEIQLTIWDDNGVASSATDDAIISFVAIPESSLFIQLTWDSTDDHELHLVHQSQEGLYCNIPTDCYSLNRTPSWFDTHPVGEGPNPRMTVINDVGLGPEIAEIDAPVAGTYRVYASHEWYNLRETELPGTQTVDIYVNGSITISAQRTLQRGDVWAIADIVWEEDGSERGTARIVPYPSDAPGEIGTVHNLNDEIYTEYCWEDIGWDFPTE